jgi:hypothetical protein
MRTLLIILVVLVIVFLAYRVMSRGGRRRF